MQNLIEELEWRGLIHTILGGTKEQLLKEPTTFYVGTDPTGRSLHIGHFQAFVVARLLQKYGHKPIILLGGATASLGDPSFKTEERKLLSREEIESNGQNIRKQLEHIIDFNSDAPNKAIMVNNYDWMKDVSMLDFAREVGKCITVNYMLSKDSVQQRLGREGSGLSLTEFLYGPLQANDFVHLYQTHNCKMQIGGSDQWGNITSGNELIRKKLGSDKETFAFVFPLVTRADGKKFGKSEGGKNVWLNRDMTSPYEFYQFWMNQSDDDSKMLIKRFTLLPKEEIEALIKEHEEAPQKRILQNVLAKEVTTMVHSKEDYENAVQASKILFGNGTADALKTIDEQTLLSAMDGVSKFEIDKSKLDNDGMSLVDLMVSETKIAPSKNEYRKLIQGGGLSINKNKVNTVDMNLKSCDLLNGKYLLVQKGKKNYNLVIAK